VIHQMVIYGSKARGDSHADSDLDVLLIVRNEAVALRRLLRRLGYDLAVAFNTVPSILAYTQEEWERRKQSGSPFREAVERDAVSVMDNTGMRENEAELHRIKGELLLRQAISAAPQAEACFQQAIAAPRRQQAKSWELRAAISLARLWQQQDKHQEALELLAPVYGWFTEGFDTADLQEAKVLLDV
jgi:hypothetical protein